MSSRSKKEKALSGATEEPFKGNDPKSSTTENNIPQKQKKSNDDEKDNRARNWTFVVYPESAPANWEAVLDDGQIPWIQSPLHDKDIKPDDNTPKKPHWHIVCCFSGKKGYEQVLAITKKLNATIPERVKDIRSMIRYLTHIDFPSKAQYQKSDITLHGGVDVDIDSYFLTKADLKQIRLELFNYVFENDITEICDLVDYARQNRQDWYEQIVQSDFMLLKCIDSRRHKKENMKQPLKVSDKNIAGKLADEVMKK